jgi:hypothetical protein
MLPNNKRYSYGEYINSIKNNNLLIFILGLFFLLTSCSPRIVGTWSVQKYERSTPGNEGMSVSNIGKITFDRNGSGKKDLDYSLLGVSENDKTPFEWSATEEYITIDSENSELSKTWIYIENKRTYQKWKSTDGSNSVQTLIMTKE